MTDTQEIAEVGHVTNPAHGTLEYQQNEAAKVAALVEAASVDSPVATVDGETAPDATDELPPPPAANGTAEPENVS